MLFFCGAQQRLKQLTQHNSGPDCSLCRASVDRVAQAYRVGKHEVYYLRDSRSFIYIVMALRSVVEVRVDLGGSTSKLQLRNSNTHSKFSRKMSSSSWGA